MAKIITNLKDLPERTKPLPPGSKPPITGFPFAERGNPEEVDEFLELLRQMRREELEAEQWK